ncbi:MAG TPA: TetR/AcrR family transcriptional regulator [Kofleriaceae bacterium]|nr:TetR/AcrR family transcriptional regulator [Kofleriaceae bacterium]
MTSNVQRDAERRREILDAALACFVQFGYAKTSLDDIARRANLSRPLLYRKYKNKEDIYGAVYDDVFETRYPIAEQVLAGRGSRKARLYRIYEVLCVETWALVRDAPMAQEFYDACLQVSPEIHAKHERKLLELTRKVLGSRELAEVLMLAVDGLFVDLPSVAVLRKRLRVLIDRFV